MTCFHHSENLPSKEDLITIQEIRLIKISIQNFNNLVGIRSERQVESDMKKIIFFSESDRLNKILIVKED